MGFEHPTPAGYASERYPVASATDCQQNLKLHTHTEMKLKQNSFKIVLKLFGFVSVCALHYVKRATYLRIRFLVNQAKNLVSLRILGRSQRRMEITYSL